MESIEERTIWNKACVFRKLQHICGFLSAIFFSVALLSLFDGLQAKMRSGPQELDLLAGEGLLISGPCPVKNPVMSDVLSHWAPEDAPAAFLLEGFYTGYWFGSGMWRGEIKAQDSAKTGSYKLTISFKGAPAQSRQSYIVNIYENLAAHCAGSKAFIFKFLNINSFLLASILAPFAIGFGICTYICGRKYAGELSKLGLFEIYRVDSGTKTAWCLPPKKLVPKSKTECKVYSAEGLYLTTVKTGFWEKGKLNLFIPADINISENDLVCLNPDSCGFL